MPTLTVLKNYLDNTTLTQTQIDQAFQSVETFLNTTKLDSTNLQTGAVVNATIAAASIDTTKLQGNSVTSAILASDASVNNSRAVTTNHIQDAQITLTKMALLSVGTGQIVDASITQAKKAAVPTQISTGTGNTLAGYLALTDVPGLSVPSQTYTGRPVLLALINDYPTTTPNRGALNASSGTTNSDTTVVFYRDTTIIAKYGINIIAGLGVGSITALIIPPILHVDLGANAGNHTYKIGLQGSSGGGADATNLKLIAVEL